MCYPLLKRLFDLVMASFGLLLLLPAGLLIALFIKLSDGGPIFYTQIRIGQFGRPFPIRKFRSMVVNADQLGLPVTPEGDPRITWIGRLLRKTKLDEVPQLWNVWVGQMSFVGPRPEVARYVDRYTPAQREILKYKPGITDLASILFRNEEELLRGSRDVEDFYVRYCLPRKIDLNRRYAGRAGLLQDIWIILQTLCPYWVGLLTLYATTLTVSLFLAYQLRFDFDLPRQDFIDFLRVLPWMVTTQLVFLFWRGQFRGLLSYFSIPELRQTMTALGLAFLVQLVLWNILPASFLPARSILPLDLLVSLFALCAVRLFFRSMREHSSVPNRQATQPSRIAVIGTGELATNLALDFAGSNDPNRKVVAFFDDDARMWHKCLHNIPVIGMPECLLNREWLEELDEIIIALPDENSARRKEIGDMLQGSRRKVSSVSTWPAVYPLAH